MADQDIEAAADQAVPQVRATIPINLAGIAAQDQENDDE